MSFQHKSPQHKTSWKLYTSNKIVWRDMLKACEEAKESIDLEQFVFFTDDFGNRLIDVCARKASEGVKVRFIWDAAGSFSFFGSRIVDKLKKRGIELVFFKTLFPSLFEYHNYKSWYFRNHRRSLIVDKKVAFTGSICIHERMKNWRDTNIRIEGSVVKNMNTAFQRMWNRAKEKKNLGPIAHYDKTDDFQYITSSPIPRHRNLYKEVTRSIKNAKEYIYITNPYFVPTRKIIKLLKNARSRNVDVKIIIPERTNHILVDLASRTFFKGLLEAGIEIHLYKGEMVHSKTMVIDGSWSTIGTLNMDNISLLYNFEANIVSTNKKFTEELKNNFLKDLSKSFIVTEEEWQNRYWIEKVVSFFVKLIRDLL